MMDANDISLHEMQVNHNFCAPPEAGVQTTAPAPAQPELTDNHRDRNDAALIANGHEPVAVLGKAPVATEWQRRPNTPEALAAERAAHPHATSTGLRTGRLVGVDIDVKRLGENGVSAPAEAYEPSGRRRFRLRADFDPAQHAAAIEAVVYEVLGYTDLRRVGAKGAMLAYRNETPISKIIVKGKHRTLWQPDRRHSNHSVPLEASVELLGVGQQFVAYGIHPDTRQPYTWTNAGADPLNRPLADFMEVTPDKLRDLAECVRAKLEELGYDATISSRGLHQRARQEAKERVDKYPVPADQLIEILGCIAPDCDRKAWIAVLGGIRATNLHGVPPDDMDNELLEIAKAWSRGDYSRTRPGNWEGEDDVEHTYWTLDPMKPGGATFGTLYALAQQAGYDKPPPSPPASALHNEAHRAAIAAAASPAGAPQEWGEPMDVFGDALTPEPLLTADMLPPTIAAFAADEARRKGVDLAMIAIPALVVCASALHDGIQIQPRERDTGWRESARLWAAGVSPSGTMKTSTLNAALAPLRSVEKRWRSDDAHTLRLYEQKQALHKTLKGAVDLDERPKPTMRRLIVGDSTTEQLANILADNARGVLIKQDELSGWIGGFDAYRGNGAHKDRAAALELWNGGDRTVDRVKGSVAVPNWGACIVGNIQDDKLRDMATHQKMVDDGLLQRFLLFPGRQVGLGEDREPDAAALASYAETVECLTSLRPEMLEREGRAHTTVCLSPKARPYWDEIERLAFALRQLPSTGASFASWLAKVPGNFARLLLTCHAIVNASAIQWGIAPDVSAETAKRARDLMVGFFIPYTQRLYATLFRSEDDGEVMRQTARFILREHRERVTDRDLSKDGPNALRGGDAAGSRQHAMGRLAECEWVRKEGWAPPSWAINPRVYERFATVREQEQRRCAEVRQRLTRADETVRGVYGRGEG